MDTSSKFLPAAIAALCMIAACGGDATVGGSADAPWETSVDSTGDTVRVRIVGEIPARLVRSLVVDLEVGEENGSDEESFGGIGTVMPTVGGGLLVHDYQPELVRMFDSTGRFVRNLGAKGGGPGEYGDVNGIAPMPEGRVVLWDASGARLNYYESDGRFRSTSRLPFRGFFSQNILYSDDAGNAYAWAVLVRDSVDFTRGVRGVIRLDSTGTVRDSIPYPLWREPPPALIARSPDGGGMSSYSMPFWPVSIARVAPGGGFVGGPGDPYVLFLTGRPGAKPMRIERDHVPVPVTERERVEQKAFITSGLRRTDPNWSWNVADLASTKPAYRQILVGRDGRFWVQISTAAEDIPTAELPTPRPGQESLPRITTRDPSVYDVFTPDGRLLGRVALPPRTRILTVAGPYAWGVRRDSQDIEYAARFRIEPAWVP